MDCQGRLRAWAVTGRWAAGRARLGRQAAGQATCIFAFFVVFFSHFLFLPIFCTFFFLDVYMFAHFPNFQRVCLFFVVLEKFNLFGKVAFHIFSCEFFKLDAIFAGFLINFCISRFFAPFLSGVALFFVHFCIFFFTPSQG